MKKIPDFVRPESVSPTPSNINPEEIFKAESVSPTPLTIHSEEIFKELEISQRTQRPPSEELIARLNALASRPPFCYILKVKKNYPL